MSSVLPKETEEDKVEKLTMYNVSLIIGWQIKSIISHKMSSHRGKFYLMCWHYTEKKKKKNKNAILFMASFVSGCLSER